MAEPKPKTKALRSEYRIRVEVLDDGSIKNRNWEVYACLLADGLAQSEAWHLSRNEPTGTKISYAYRKRLEAASLFKERLAYLCEEKDRLMADEPYGPIIWQARQGYRLAVARADHKEMRANTELLLKLVEQQRISGGGKGPTVAEAPKKVGKPVSDTPQVDKKPSAFREMLRQKGMVPPGSEAKVEDAA